MPNQKLPRGKLIFVEGVDGSGKSTAAELIKDKLAALGRRVEVANILKDDPVSAKVRAILTDPENNIHPDAEACLYAAAVNNVFRHKVLPLLEQGIDVVCDRCHISTWAYQIAPQLDIGNSRPSDIFHAAYANIVPDAFVMIFVNPTKGLERVVGRDGKLDRLEMRGPEFMAIAQRAYRHYCDSVSTQQQVFTYDNDTTLQDLNNFIDKVIAQITL
jgi:dTMP kinase